VFVFARLKLLVVCAAVTAVLAVALAPLWHQHDHGCGHYASSDAQPTSGHAQHADCHDHSHAGHYHPLPDHNHPQPGQEQPGDKKDQRDCPVCIAIHTPIGSGLGEHGQVVVARLALGPVGRPSVDEPVLSFLPVLWPCGPPAGRG